jgi:hypothetical protein
MRRAHDFQSIRSPSGQPAPDLLSSVPWDSAFQPTGRRNEDKASSRNTASRLESGFCSHLESATGSPTQSVTQSTDPVDCLAAPRAISGSVESSGLGSVKGSGKTIRQRASRLESRLESGLESRLESAVRPVPPGSTRQVAGQVAGQVTAQVTAQVAASRNPGEIANREIGSRGDKNQSPPALLPTRYSLLASHGESA